MAFELGKDFLDVENITDKLGWYSPLYYFIFLFYYNPNSLTLSLMIISAVFCYASLKISKSFASIYAKKGKPDFKKIVKKESLPRLMNILLPAFIYIILPYIALMLSFTHLFIFII
ncbi:hypothetical protein HY637_00455, partial [Candidatus Woesearchaeota archaeon]|nr:hypothetical protein [Candidatus Woesearchaeota archaeon]